MADELKDQRIITLMTPSELEAIDEWSFANRIRSRGEAIRRLCQTGLSVESREVERKAIVDTYLHDLKVADEALGKLREDGASDFGDRLAGYVDAVTSFMNISDSLLMEVVYLRSMINSAASAHEVEKVVGESQKLRELFKGHVFLGGEMVRVDGDEK